MKDFKKRKFYIKERHNPQFKKPYYLAYGQLTKKDAKKIEETAYGYNIALEYETESEYREAIKTLNAK